MAKRTTKTPEEENLENVQEATGGENVSQEVEQTAEETADGGIRCMVSQVKDGVAKVAETLDEGFEAYGVALVDGSGQTLLIVDLNEDKDVFSFQGSENLDEDVVSPSMSGLDGQQRSEFLINFYERREISIPALHICTSFGWLPSGGEMALIFANKTAINEMIESLGGTPIGDGRYWTSQRFSNERMWSINMSDGTFGIALGTASVAGVRAVKK